MTSKPSVNQVRDVWLGIIVMQNLLRFHVQELLTNMAQQLLQDVEVVFCIDSHLRTDCVLINGPVAIKENDHENFASRLLLAHFSTPIRFSFSSTNFLAGLMGHDGGPSFCRP